MGYLGLLPKKILITNGYFHLEIMISAAHMLSKKI